jgi:hypothetical protein
MKTTALVLALALALAAPLSLFAEPLKGSFLLSADSMTSPTKPISTLKGQASVNGKAFSVSADEITIDQSELTRKGVTLVTCRGVTSVSTGYTISASKELTFEIDGRANIYRLDPASIVVSATPNSTGRQFSQSLPKLDLTLRATAAQK